MKNYLMCAKSFEYNMLHFGIVLKHIESSVL